MRLQKILSLVIRKHIEKIIVIEKYFQFECNDIYNAHFECILSLVRIVTSKLDRLRPI